MSRHAVALLVALLMLPSPVALGRVPPATALDCLTWRGDAAPDAEEQAALEAINDLRQRNGVAPLALSPALTRAARWKAEALAAGAPFTHADAQGDWERRLADCGYHDRGAAGENLALGVMTGAAVVRQWESSPPHRANLLDASFRVIGIARARGGEWGWYWAANFGAAPDAG